jgi:hypothetical protein
MKFDGRTDGRTDSYSVRLGLNKYQRINYFPYKSGRALRVWSGRNPRCCVPKYLTTCHVTGIWAATRLTCRIVITFHSTEIVPAELWFYSPLSFFFVPNQIKTRRCNRQVYSVCSKVIAYRKDLGNVILSYTVWKGRSIAQAVSRWLLTAAAHFRVWVWSYGICDGQSCVGAGFLRVLRFPLTIIIPPIAPQSPPSII